MPLTRILLVLAWVTFLGALAPACSHDIGDECKTSVDCDPNGTRACDLSQPGGYCTVAGCDEKSCPSGSTCIRYFPEMFLSKPCVAATEDVAAAGVPATDDCTADELCLDSGVCAKRSFEQRACAKSCGSNGDCRSGYECRLAGTRGSMVLAGDPNATTRFCAPYTGPAN